MISIRSVLVVCIVAAVAAMLPGCHQSLPPVQSATVTFWKYGKVEISEQQLTPEQITQISDWLGNHSWGWHPVTATYRPETVFRVLHSGRLLTSINITGSVIVVGQKQRDLSRPERQELHSILGLNHALHMPRSNIHGNLRALRYACAADLPHRFATERTTTGA
ncbi:hypothetical protein D3C71_1317240 [compost metagenome]|jgi:hypothetical protein